MKQKKVLVLIFLLSSWLGCAQTIFQGRVTDAFQTSVSGVSVKVRDTVQDRIIAYAITDGQGYFKLEFLSDLPQLELTVNAIGFTAVQQSVTNESRQFQFTLKREAIQLENVELQYSPIQRQGDTLSYDVDAFSHKSDRVIADVISHMPGVDIKENGQIYYRGEPINKFYIEGIDLLGGKYNLASNNLPYQKVESVQILKNHQPIKMLQGRVFSNQSALNITLKEAYTFTGQAEVGVGGSPFLWEAKITPMLFSEKRQFLGVYQTNNTGRDLHKPLTNLIKSSEEETDWVSIIESTPPASFSEKRWLDNTSHLLSVNTVEKLNEDYQLRLNLNYLNDYQKQKGQTETRFFTPTDTVPVYETITNRLNNNKLEGRVRISRNTASNYLNNTFRFQRDWFEAFGGIQRRDGFISQVLNNDDVALSNEFETVFEVGREKLQVNSVLRYQKQAHALQVKPGPFLGLINNGKPYEDLLQKVDLERFYTANSVQFHHDAGALTISPKLGFLYEDTQLNSGLFPHQKSVISSAFKNELHWQKAEAYIDLQTSALLGDWKMTLKTPLRYRNFQLSSEDSNSMAFLNFDPQLYINFNPLGKWEYRVNFSRQHDYGNLQQLYPGFILSSYRNIQRYDVPLLERKNWSASAEVSYENIIAMMMGHFSYTYTTTHQNLMFGSTVLSNGATTIEAVEHPFRQEIHLISGVFDKYLSFLKSEFSVDVGVMVMDSKVMINENFGDYHNDTWRFGAELSRKITDWLRLSYRGQYTVAKRKLLGRNFYQTQAQSHQIQADFHLDEQHAILMNAEYLHSQLRRSQRHNWFADITYRYSLESIDFELQARNLFDNSLYQTATMAAYSYQEFTYHLRPFQVLLKIRFSF